MDPIQTFDKLLDNDEWFSTFQKNLESKFENVKLEQTNNGFLLTLCDVSHKLTHFNQTLIDVMDCFNGNFKLGKTNFFEGTFILEGIL